MATKPNFTNFIKNIKKEVGKKIKENSLKKLQDENENLHKITFGTAEKSKKIEQNRMTCNLETEKIMNEYNIKLQELESKFDSEVIELQKKHIKIENNILRNKDDQTITILK